MAESVPLCGNGGAHQRWHSTLIEGTALLWIPSPCSCLWVFPWLLPSPTSSFLPLNRPSLQNSAQVSPRPVNLFGGSSAGPPARAHLCRSPSTRSRRVRSLPAPRPSPHHPPDHREFPGGQDPGPDWLGSSSLPCPSVQRFQMCVGWRYLLVFCTEAVPDYCRRGDADNKILLSDLISQPQRLCQRSHSSFGE